MKSLEDLLRDIRAGADASGEKLTIKPTFISIAVPFTHFEDGTRGFTRHQLEDDEAVARFHKEFKEWFRYDPIVDRAIFLEKSINARPDEA